MCGRYYVDTDNLDIKLISKKLSEDMNMFKTGDVFPSDNALIVIEGRTPKPVIYKWGFPISGSSKLIINARSESIGQKQMFKSAMNCRRCIVPTNGFYEWQKPDNKKLLFNYERESVLYLAGIWSVFNNQRCFSIITRDAEAPVSDYHNRMPLIVKKENVRQWLFNPSFANEYINCSTAGALSVYNVL